MSIVLLGSTSGSCTLQEQAVAGTSVLTLPVGTGTVVANNVNSAIVSGTAVASTSGTSIDFTGIPSWVKRVTVMFQGVSTNGTSNLQIQLGDAGGIEATSYVAASQSLSAATSSTTGFIFTQNSTASDLWHGQMIISLIGSNAWAYTSVANNPTSIRSSAGTKTLSDVLDRVRLTTVNGTDTFDAGTINILYE
jgi:hypothetical protein